MRESGWNVVTVDLRATGKLARPGEKVGRAPDHHSAEWALWIGRPLLGQWVWDLTRLLDALADVDNGLPARVAVIGNGPAGLVALSAAATDARITHVAAVDTLASYISDVPYQGQRLGVMAPGILREIGDVPHLAALCAPRRVVIAGGVWGNGKALADKHATHFRFAEDVWGLLRAQGELRLMASGDATRIVENLK
jgi:hypothetical protein